MVEKWPIDDETSDMICNIIQNYICRNCDEENGESASMSSWEYIFEE